MRVEDERIRGVQVDLVLGDFSLFSSKTNDDGDLSQQVLEMNEKNRRLDSALDGLGYNKTDFNKLKLRNRYLKYHLITNGLLILGLGLIILSVLIEPGCFLVQSLIEALVELG